MGVPNSHCPGPQDCQYPECRCIDTLPGRQTQYQCLADTIGGTAAVRMGAWVGVHCSNLTVGNLALSGVPLSLPRLLNSSMIQETYNTKGMQVVSQTGSRNKTRPWVGPWTCQRFFLVVEV